MENVTVDLGHGFVKAISSSGKRSIFPSLVGQGYERGVTLVDGAKQVNIERALVFPQGALAIFSALINHDGKYTYPQFMSHGSLIGLIDIGFRTADFVVVEIQQNGSFRGGYKLG